jgi:hypothetical protein
LLFLILLQLQLQLQVVVAAVFARHPGECRDPFCCCPLSSKANSKIKLDPGIRRDDEQERPTARRKATEAKATEAKANTNPGPAQTPMV